MRRGFSWAVCLGVITGLSACDMPPATSPLPKERPETEAALPSQKSQDFKRYYARVEARLLSQGLLRTDGGGPDTPFSKRQLVEDFVKIAAYDEYAVRGGRFVAQQTPSRIRRWDRPVRMAIHFGASVPADRRRTDRAEISRYVARLARLTKADIKLTDGPGANYHVLIMNTDELAAIGPELTRMIPGIDPATRAEVVALPRYTFCSVYAFSEQGRDNTYAAALAVIRDEHTPLMRRSCMHEELAQGLGLANDSPRARPSIFNDDEEFALLTRHDELLLQMLYDPRMKPGMDPDTARRVAEVLASELLGGES